MITRSPLKPHVCLSCQRSLAKRATYLRTQVAHESTQTDNSTSTVEQPSTPDTTPEPPRNDFQRFTIRKEAFVDTRRPRFPPKIRQRRLDEESTKLHGHRGRKLQENIQDLNIKSLGESAKAVVLQDSKYTFYAHTYRMDDQEPEHVDIGKLLEAERGLVSPEQVRQSIDAVRPRQERLVQSWEELNEIVMALSDGFTTAQMQGYVEHHKQHNRELVNPKTPIAGKTVALEGAEVDSLHSVTQNVPPGVSHTTLNVRPWRPGISTHADHFDVDYLQGYVVASHTAKHKIAIRIVRECWGMEAEELNDGIGQFEVDFAKGDLDLLSSGPESALAVLQDEYLANDDEAMEIFPARNAIRVITWRHKIPILLKLLGDQVASIKREAVDFGDALRRRQIAGTNHSSWRERYYSDSVLQELGRITNTDIQRLSKDVALISTFDDAKPTPSSRIDTVKRLLVTVTDTADQSERDLECNNLAEGKFIEYSHADGLNWWEKLRNWARWTTAISKDAKEEPIIGMLEASKAKKKSVVPRAKSAAPITSHTTESWWGEVHDSSALFGTVLHSPSFEGTQLTSPFDARSMHTFSTLVPNLSRTLQKTTFPNGPDGSTSPKTFLKHITLRFVADPFQPLWDGHLEKKSCLNYDYTVGIGSRGLAHLPPIEMRFLVQEDNIVKLKDVLAITSDKRSEVMLPANAIDIRYQDRTTRRLKHSHELESLQDFVSKSIFDLRKGKMITPPSLKIPIDGKILSKESLENVEFTKDCESVQYMFAGLDVRSSISLDWNGWRLIYTSIEAGQAGGRRSELRLRPFREGKVSPPEDFINAANELAHELGDSKSSLGAVFGSPAPTGKRQVQPLTSAWGVSDKGVKSGQWARQPSVFLESRDTKAWFDNQAWYDEHSEGSDEELSRDVREGVDTVEEGSKEL